MLSHWVHAECEAELVKRFTVKSDDGGQSEGLLDNLAVQLVEILVDVPLKEETALLHMEAVQTLLLLVYSAATAYMTDNKSVLLKSVTDFGITLSRFVEPPSVPSVAEFHFENEQLNSDPGLKTWAPPIASN